MTEQHPNIRCEAKQLICINNACINVNCVDYLLIKLAFELADSLAGAPAVPTSALCPVDGFVTLPSLAFGWDTLWQVRLLDSSSLSKPNGSSSLSLSSSLGLLGTSDTSDFMRGLLAPSWALKVVSPHLVVKVGFLLENTSSNFELASPPLRL